MFGVEFMQDDKIHELNISLNDLRFIDAPNYRRKGNVCGMRMFPERLEIFKATGNQIEKLPELISELGHLKHLLISGNRISDLSPIQSLRNLVQVGAACNRIQSLPQTLTWKRLLSLDLSFNELCNLEDTLSAIMPCSLLMHLKLKGNPFCLRREYLRSIRSQIPWLKTIDDIDVTSMDPIEDETDDAYDTILEMEISELELSGHGSNLDTEDGTAKIYIKFIDSEGHDICSFPFTKGAMDCEIVETKKSQNAIKNNAVELLSGFCKVTWSISPSIAEAKWIQNLHLRLLKQSIKPVELTERNSQDELLEDEVIGDCLLKESIHLLNGHPSQTIEEEAIFTTKYINEVSAPFTIATAKTKLTLQHLTSS